MPLNDNASLKGINSLDFLVEKDYIRRKPAEDDDRKCIYPIKKMQINNIRALKRFLKKHKTAERDLVNWQTLIEKSCLNNQDQLKRIFPKTRFFNQRWVVFKLGDRWRIEAKLSYKNDMLVVKRIGTHEEYNKWEFND